MQKSYIPLMEKHKNRLDAAIDYLNENPDTICIVSGGQGSNEPFPEAEGMADYLIQNGIETEQRAFGI